MTGAPYAKREGLRRGIRVTRGHARSRAVRNTSRTPSRRGVRLGEAQVPGIIHDWSSKAKQTVAKP